MILGIDLGASYIKTGIVDDKGVIKKYGRIQNQAKYGEDFLIAQILDIINEYKKNFFFEKVGIGIAGQINHSRGIILSSPNMGNLHNVFLKQTLERKSDFEVSIDNDARCFVLAEKKYGEGLGYKNIIGITLGTGIGGGIIINNHLYRGCNNMAGEIGHMIINSDSKIQCGCGNYGHFEALASGRALQNFYKVETEQETDIELIFEMAQKGEKIAQKSTIQAGYNLALGLINVIHIFNPEIIICGGGLIKLDLLWNTALNNIRSYLIHKDLKETKIVKSKLGDQAGVIGAGLLFNLF